MKYQGQVYEANVNRLSPAKNCDRLSGTSQQRYVPCRVEEV